MGCRHVLRGPRKEQACGKGKAGKLYSEPREIDVEGGTRRLGKIGKAKYGEVPDFHDEDPESDGELDMGRMIKARGGGASSIEHHKKLCIYIYIKKNVNCV